MSGAGQRRRTTRSEQGDAAIMGLGGRGVGGGLAEITARLARERVAGGVAQVVGRYAGAVEWDVNDSQVGDVCNFVIDDFPPGVWMASARVTVTLAWADPQDAADGPMSIDATADPVGVENIGSAASTWTLADASTNGGGLVNLPALIIRNRYVSFDGSVAWPDAYPDPTVTWALYFRAQRISD